MERPKTPPELDRPHKYLTELRAIVNSYCEAVPADLPRASELDVRLLDATLAQVDAPAASLQADLFALESRAVALKRA